MRHPRLFTCAVAAVAAITLATTACDGQDSGDESTPTIEPGGDTDTPTRPRITFSTSETAVEGPSEVASGFVDVHIDAGDDNGTHMLFARLNDGVTLDQILATPDELFDFITVAGGNGFVASGDTVDLTLELEPGNYVAFNINPTDPPPLAEFVVTDDDNQAPAPDEEGTIEIGPEMRLTVPENFDAEGVWRFENRDEELVHEASLIRLASGATLDDLIDWSHTFEGPPPIDGEFGSIGALGPGRQAWVDFAAAEPGDYALVCFIPGDDELPHLTQGMAASVTIAADS